MYPGRWGTLQAILFASLFLAVAVSAASPAPVRDTTTIVWEGDIHLQGHTWIPDGTLLRLEPGTRILPDPPAAIADHRSPPVLVVAGDVVALGQPDRPLLFGVPTVIQGHTPGATVIQHARFDPALPEARCALTLPPTEAHITNTTFTGTTDGLCLAGQTPEPGHQARGHASTSQQDTDPARPGPVAPSVEPLPLRPPPAASHETLASAPQPVPTVPASTIVLDSNRYENNTGTGLNLTRPAWSQDLGQPTVISNGDVVEGNDIGIRLGDPGVSLSLSNATVRDNRVGLMTDGGQARLDHVRFDENSQWDTYASPDTASIRWTGSAFEPACAHVEERVTYGCERGSVGGVTVLTILLGLIYSLLFLVSEAGRYLLTRLWMWVRLYSRIPREELLEHEARVEIQAIVADDPGIHLRGVEDEVGGYGRTNHHLYQLERGGLLKSRREGMYLRFYPVGFDPGERGPRSMKEFVLDMISKVPGIHASEIARRLDTSRQRVAYHVKTLLEEARIEAKEGDRIIHLYPRE